MTSKAPLFHIQLEYTRASRITNGGPGREILVLVVLCVSYRASVRHHGKVPAGSAFLILYTIRTPPGCVMDGFLGSYDQ